MIRALRQTVTPTESSFYLPGRLLPLGRLCAEAAPHRCSTNGYAGSHIMGIYGNVSAPYSWFLANGLESSSPGLAAKILGSGKGHASAWLGTGADYAEMFESEDGEAIEPGFFITFGPGEKKPRKQTPIFCASPPPLPDMWAIPASFIGKTNI